MNANALIRVQESTGVLHPNSQITPKDVTPHAYLWSSEQLNEMIAIIGGLLDAQGIQCTADVAKAPKSKRGRPGRSGYFEDKLINGYGPYRYLRFWQDGQRRSVYVGKVTDESRDTPRAQCVKTT